MLQHSTKIQTSAKLHGEGTCRAYCSVEEGKMALKPWIPLNRPTFSSLPGSSWYRRGQVSRPAPFHVLSEVSSAGAREGGVKLYVLLVATQERMG